MKVEFVAKIQIRKIVNLLLVKHARIIEHMVTTGDIIVWQAQPFAVYYLPQSFKRHNKVFSWRSSL